MGRVSSRPNVATEIAELSRAHDIFKAAAIVFGADLDGSERGDPVHRRAQGLQVAELDGRSGFRWGGHPMCAMRAAQGAVVRGGNGSRAEMVVRLCMTVLITTPPLPTTVMYGTRLWPITASIRCIKSHVGGQLRRCIDLDGVRLPPPGLVA